MAQQMEVIVNNYGFAIWETLYALALEVTFAYVIGLPLGLLFSLFNFYYTKSRLKKLLIL